MPSKIQRKLTTDTGGGRFMLGAFIAALIAAIAVFFAMLQFEKKELSAYEKCTVYVAKTQIPKGTIINSSNFEGFIEPKQLDKNVVSQNAIYTEEQITDLAAIYDIGQGTLVTFDMFDALDEILMEMDNPVELSIKADDLYQIVGGVLRSGDRINIFYNDEFDLVVCGWKNIYVKDVFDNSGKKIEGGDNISQAQRINIYIDEDEVEDLYSKMTPGSIRVVKVY